MPKWLAIVCAVIGACITIGLPTTGAVFYFGQLDQRITAIENDKGAALSVTLQHIATKLVELNETQKVLVEHMHNQNIRNAEAAHTDH